MSGPSNRTATRVALIRAEIVEIRRILFGDSKGREGLVERVKELVKTSDHGRFTRRVALWCAAIIVIIATGIVHYRQTFLQIFRE
jgi:hypothetical protein